MASPHLFVQSCGDQVFNEVKIHECRGKNDIAPHIEYTLSHVILSHYFSCGQRGDQTLETMRLSFTKIEMKSQGKKPIATGYDLEKAQTL